tara:strand:- start:419 stop:670 length:252 start_codon:yes stop_codon:yes gene_type:complete
MIQTDSQIDFNEVATYNKKSNAKIINKLYRRIIASGLWSSNFDDQYFAGRYGYMFTTTLQGDTIYVFKDLLTDLTFHVGGVRL